MDVSWYHDLRGWVLVDATRIHHCTGCGWWWFEWPAGPDIISVGLLWGGGEVSEVEEGGGGWMSFGVGMDGWVGGWMDGPRGLWVGLNWGCDE
jgi:hypothetical protein